MKKDCGCAHQKCNNTPKDKMCPKHGMEDCTLKEEGLRNWFKGSSSKDGNSSPSSIDFSVGEIISSITTSSFSPVEHNLPISLTG